MLFLTVGYSHLDMRNRGSTKGTASRLTPLGKPLLFQKESCFRTLGVRDPPASSRAEGNPMTAHSGLSPQRPWVTSATRWTASRRDVHSALSSSRPRVTPGAHSLAHPTVLESRACTEHLTSSPEAVGTDPQVGTTRRRGNLAHEGQRGLKRGFYRERMPPGHSVSTRPC